MTTKQTVQTVTIPKSEYDAYREAVNLIRMQDQAESERREIEHRLDNKSNDVMCLLRGDGGRVNLFEM